MNDKSDFVKDCTKGLLLSVSGQQAYTPQRTSALRGSINVADLFDFATQDMNCPVL